MRNFLSLLFLILIFNGCSTIKKSDTLSAESEHKNGTGVDFSEQSSWLLGYFNFNQITSQPHSEWFFKEYDNYQINNEYLNKLLETDNDSISIKIVLGTWCPDSRREVPRFMRITDLWQFPAAKINFIGVDNAKLSPVGEYESLDIQRVPTFIIYKNNIESGRIIETPKTSLEQDLVNILKGTSNN